MADLKSGIILNADEKLVMELEAELWAESNNIFARLIGTIRRIIALIFGFKKKSFVVITDKRVVEVSQDKACWVFNLGKTVTYLLPSSVKEVGYLKQGSFCGCFCQSYYLYYEAFTQRRSILLSLDEEADVQRIVDAFYKSIARAQ